MISTSSTGFRRGKHTLEVALFAIGVAGKGGLWLLLLELIENLAVGDVAHLVVLVDDQALAVTNATLALGHHGITGVVCLADVAVYALPALFTLAVMALARQSVVSVGQRATQRLGAVLTAKAGGTCAFAARLGAVGVLVALEAVQVAIKAWWAVVRSVSVY